MHATMVFSTVGPQGLRDSDPGDTGNSQLPPVRSQKDEVLERDIEEEPSGL
jgi:hypothetical protein